MDGSYYSDAIGRVKARGGAEATRDFDRELMALAHNAMRFAQLARDDAKDIYGQDFECPGISAVFAPMYAAMIKRHMEGDAK